MQINKNSKNLLMILAFMLVARFLIVPIFDWQTGQLEDIKLKNQRVEKAKQVLNNQAVFQRELVSLKDKNQQLESVYFNNQSNQSFKLKQQQLIESIFATHKVSIRSFNWVVELPGDITEYRVKIDLEGKGKNLAQLQLALSQKEHWFKISEWVLRVQKSSSKSFGDMSGYMMIVLHGVPKADLAATPLGEII